MKNLSKLFLGAAVSFSLLAVSCSSDDDHPGIDPPQGDFVNGYFVLNEGNFGAANASVLFIGYDGTVQNNIFTAVNGTNLGDTAQSMVLDDDRAYIVVNGSNSITVVNSYTFEHIGNISTGLMNPRYMEIENGKGYVSNWGDPSNPNDDFIAVINLNAMTVASTIPVAEGPEKMETKNGKLYVAHPGGHSQGNTVSVINTSDNTVLSSIQVGDIPVALEEENGILYVLCGGNPAWTGQETSGKLVLISTASDTTVSSFDFPAGQHPLQLAEDNGKLYYTVDDLIFSADLNPSLLPDSPVFSTAAQGVFTAYAFEVEDGKIYVGDAGDFMSDGRLLVYTTSGTLENTFDTGALPNGVYFN